MVTYDLHRLRILRELERRRTLAAVASALGYSPSAISQQLSVLEKDVGLILLEKAGRGVRLTDAGQLLASHAATMLAAAEAAQSDLASLSGEVRGTVRAGGLQSGTHRVLIPALAAIMRTHPQVRVEIAEIELEQALPNLQLGSLDVVVSDEYDGHPRPRPADVHVEVLLQEPLKLILSAHHQQAQGSGPVPITALRTDVWASSATGTGHHALVLSTCRAIGGYEPDIRHRSNDADVQLELVRATHAVALLPPLTLPADDRSLAIHDIAETTINRRLTALTRATPPAPALETFLSAIRTQAYQLQTP